MANACILRDASVRGGGIKRQSTARYGMEVRISGQIVLYQEMTQPAARLSCASWLRSRKILFGHLPDGVGRPAANVVLGLLRRFSLVRNDGTAGYAGCVGVAPSEP